MNKKALLRKRADKLLQEIGREIYNTCYVCGSPISCLHHFFTKGSCSALRYDWDNLVPICNRCHFRHHNTSDPTIHATIMQKKGNEWYEGLLIKKRSIPNTGIKYYEDLIERLRKILKNPTQSSKRF